MKDRKEFKCANCKTAGHVAIERECPIFQAKRKTLHACFPDYRYRFFPTNDPATWETEGEAIVETATPNRSAGGEGNTTIPPERGRPPPGPRARETRRPDTGWEGQRAERAARVALATRCGGPASQRWRRTKRSAPSGLAGGGDPIPGCGEGETNR